MLCIVLIHMLVCLCVPQQTGRLEPQPGRTLMEAFEGKVNSVLNKARDDAGASLCQWVHQGFNRSPYQFPSCAQFPSWACWHGMITRLLGWSSVQLVL